jgi:hypothetical protein
MPAVVTFGAILFAIGLTLGLICHRRQAWSWVDVVYYPVAAVGVALLFLSGATQRNLLQIDERLEQNASELKALQATRPSVDGIPPKELIDSSFGLMDGVVELAIACGKVPGMDATCSVAEKMRSAVAEFSKVAASSYETPELRLAAACAAGDALVAKLRTAEHMSSLVGDELAAQVADARSRARYFMDYSATMQDAASFERKARARVSEVRAMIADKSEAMTYVFAVNEAEIKAASTVIYALFPCVAVPQSKIEPLANWTVKRQSQETEKNRLEELKRQAVSAPAMSRSLQWMQLNLWPFVLIAGLAFKFAKGVATVRMSAIDKRAAKLADVNAPESGTAGDSRDNSVGPTVADEGGAAEPDARDA